VIQLIIGETQKPDAKSFYDDYEIAKLYAFSGNFDKAMLSWRVLGLVIAAG